MCVCSCCVKSSCTDRCRLSVNYRHRDDAELVSECLWCVRDDVGGCNQQSVAANETVTTSSGDLQLLIVDAESVDVSCTDTDVTSVDMASEVITVLHKFQLVIFCAVVLLKT